MAKTASSNAGFAGQKSPTSSSSDFNASSFLIQQLLGRVRTIQLAQVMKVTNAGGVAPVGLLDVQLLVNMLDGQNQATQHATIFQVPYFRLQGGLNAVIIDPVVGDIGMVAIADRDISAVKSSKKQSNPGSLRRFDLADAIYLGGVLNGTPTQYLRFVQDGDGAPAGLEAVDALGNSVKTSAAGIILTDKFGHIINMKSDGIAITGDVTVTGKLTTSDDTFLGGTGGQFVKLADGSNATKVKAK